MKLYKSNNYYPDASTYYLITSDSRSFSLTYWNKTKKVTAKPLGKVGINHQGFNNASLISSIPNILKTIVFQLQKKPV